MEKPHSDQFTFHCSISEQRQEHMHCGQVPDHQPKESRLPISWVNILHSWQVMEEDMRRQGAVIQIIWKRKPFLVSSTKKFTDRQRGLVLYRNSLLESNVCLGWLQLKFNVIFYDVLQWETSFPLKSPHERRAGKCAVPWVVVMCTLLEPYNWDSTLGSYPGKI